MENEVELMEVVKVPIVGKIVANGLVKFDLKALSQARPDLATEWINKGLGPTLGISESTVHEATTESANQL